MQLQIQTQNPPTRLPMPTYAVCTYPPLYWAYSRTVNTITNTNTQIPIKIQIQNPPTRNPFTSYALAALTCPCIVRCLHYLPTAQCDLMLWTSHPPRHTEPNPGLQLLISHLQPFFDALSRRVWSVEQKMLRSDVNPGWVEFGFGLGLGWVGWVTSVTADRWPLSGRQSRLSGCVRPPPLALCHI